MTHWLDAAFHNDPGIAELYGRDIITHREARREHPLWNPIRYSRDPRKGLQYLDIVYVED